MYSNIRIRLSSFIASIQINYYWRHCNGIMSHHTVATSHLTFDILRYYLSTIRVLVVLERISFIGIAYSEHTLVCSIVFTTTKKTTKWHIQTHVRLPLFTSPTSPRQHTLQ